MPVTVTGDQKPMQHSGLPCGWMGRGAENGDLAAAVGYTRERRPEGAPEGGVISLTPLGRRAHVNEISGAIA